MTLSTFLLTRMSANDPSSNSYLLIQKIFTSFFNECDPNMSADDIFTWVYNKCENNNTLINIYERLELEYQASKDSYVYPIPKTKTYITINWNIVKNPSKPAEKQTKPNFSQPTKNIIPNPTTTSPPPDSNNHKNNNNNHKRRNHNKNHQSTSGTGSQPPQQHSP